MPWDDYLSRISAREKIEAWHREAEQRRAAHLAAAHPSAPRVSGGDAERRATTRRLRWGRLGAKLASRVRLFW